MNTLLRTLLLATAVCTASAQDPKATYLFDGNLLPAQSGAPTLTALDPLGANAFETATVFGQARTVYHLDGNSTVGQQAGLSLSPSGLFSTPYVYSAEIVFESLGGAGTWRRLLSTQTGDNGGLYISTTGSLYVQPVGGSVQSNLDTGFHHIALAIDYPTGGVKGYIDGTFAFNISSPTLNVFGDPMRFFIDSVGGSGSQTEYADSRVALIRLHDRTLSASEISARASDPFNPAFVPEPSSAVLLLFGAAFCLRRRTLRTT